MGTVRLNITLSEELFRQVARIAGPRKKSQFIAEAVREKIQKIGEEELRKLLEEGYKEGKRESLAISREFEAADLEGWDDY